ncbi:MAG TPA: diguanylate cyclase [Candidatus Angelobacter sp.]|jgi:diguanylate cyclase (GGDEF)-like protein/PAS domain S-box-containing protein|nr:diguanylate cyclase [Candidatus Angelobacter sp.]
MSTSPRDWREHGDARRRSHASADDTERMRALVSASTLALVMLDPAGRVVSWNSGAERLMGYPAGDIVGRHVGALHALDERAGLDAWLTDVARTGGHESEGWRVHRDHSTIWASVITTPLRDDDGNRLLGFLCIIRDASASRHAEIARQQTTANLQQLASTDALTGLKNRREFERVLRTIPREPFAVLAIDVDNLKAVNDDEGHAAGDHLLRSVAITLSLLVRGWDVLARLGGDEFAVLVPGAEGEEAAKVAERMRVAMHSVPSCTARISVGWAAAPAGADPAAVWSWADRCLYRAKRAGGDRVAGGVVGEDDSPGEAGSSASAAEVLARLLAGEPVTTVYQPIVGLFDGVVAGYEALLRPGGAASTDSVEPVFAMARRSGRIRDLDWASRRAALDGARHLPADATLFLNVSLTFLLDPVHDVDQLQLLLRWAGWPASRTVLELGERTGSVRRLLEVLASYRAEGIRFALNDVGDPFASQAMLDAVQPEFVKMARRLTMTASRPSSRSRIQAALAFSRSTGAAVIAEGIENEFAATQMRDLGVELGQGFGLAEPAAPDALSAPRPLLVRGRDAGR